MNVSARRFAIALLSLSALALVQVGTPSAQAPEEPKNLKVLPKNMSRREVIGVMRTFSQALGVRCIECHVSTKPGSDRLEDIDFSKDDKPEKETARKMMKMVDGINEQVAKMNLKDAPEVRCITCHHGVKRPETLSARLMRTAEKDGANGAVESYRKLRDQYYGSGAYDFSSGALPEVAGRLAEEKKDFDGALQLLKLNLEFFPEDAETHVVTGRVQMAKGDKTAAVASFEKALQIDPNNRWAKQALERAKSGQ